MALFTTEDYPIGVPAALVAAARLGLPVSTETFTTGHTSTHSYTRVTLGTVLVVAFDEKWRDLGSGPSWQEKYMLAEDVTVPIEWDPRAEGSYAVRVRFAVTSLVRQGGAKWGGVSVAVRDDVAHRPSTHELMARDYVAFEQLGTLGSLYGNQATLLPGVSFREVPYKHEPSVTHWVLDLG